MYQIHLNYLGNYIPNAWTRETGCSVCDLDLLDLSAVKVRALCTGARPFGCSSEVFSDS